MTTRRMILLAFLAAAVLVVLFTQPLHIFGYSTPKAVQDVRACLPGDIRFAIRSEVARTGKRISPVEDPVFCGPGQIPEREGCTSVVTYYPIYYHGYARRLLPGVYYIDWRLIPEVYRRAGVNTIACRRDNDAPAGQGPVVISTSNPGMRAASTPQAARSTPVPLDLEYNFERLDTNFSDYEGFKTVTPIWQPPPAIRP